MWIVIVFYHRYRSLLTQSYRSLLWIIQHCSQYVVDVWGGKQKPCIDWTPPEQGFVKLNFECRCTGRPGPQGRGIVRDQEGTLMVYTLYCPMGRGFTIEAELSSVLDGLGVVNLMEVRRVENLKGVAEREGGGGSWRFHNIERWSSNREGNRETDHMAKEGAQLITCIDVI